MNLLRSTFSLSILSLLLSLNGCEGVADDNTTVCAPDVLDYHSKIGIKIEKVGNVPNKNKGPYSYNMAPFESFNRKGKKVIFFLDQKEGIVFWERGVDDVVKIWDMKENEIPDGLDLDWWGGLSFVTSRVKSISFGRDKEEIVVVHTSKSLPTGWSKPDAPLPAPGSFPGFMCSGDARERVRDMYRVGKFPDGCSILGDKATGEFFTVYDVFSKYTLNSENVLVDPKPFFVVENQIAHGHNGGGITTIHKSNKKKTMILYAVGDCLPYGTTGMYAPQLDSETCGKILAINIARKGDFKIVAKGIRNPQQFQHSKKGDKLYFMDIGGVTAEEVNAIKVKDLMYPRSNKQLPNFGWGRNIHDGKAREGTFYMGPGDAGILSTEPPCEEKAPSPDFGYIQPWIQFGRSAQDAYYAISGFAVPETNVDKVKLIFTEFNTGYLMGTTRKFRNGKGVVKSHKFRMYYDGEEVNSINDVTAIEMNTTSTRCDPRMFTHTDGSAGLLVERSGAYYKLTEIEINEN